jgi:hypothetical protein
MVRFFGAYEQFSHKPLVNKNNSLNMCASSIAEALENSYFLCVTRDPLFLAQSLLRARIDLQGDASIGLWVDNLDKPNTGKTVYIEDICQQIVFHEQKAKEQQKIIGPERFWIISYEEFCKKPEQLVKRVSEHILKRPIQAEQIAQTLKPFQINNKMTIKPELFENIKQTFNRLSRNTEEVS